MACGQRQRARVAIRHPARMSVRQAIIEVGGVATYAQLRTTTSERAIQRALREGQVHRDRRGRYAVVDLDRHRRLAHELTAVLSHESAALQHGWGIKQDPPLPHVTVRRKRRLSRSDQARVHAHWRDLPSDAVESGVTSAVTTVTHCAGDLPFDRALAVADSALRAGHITRAELVTAADAASGPGSAVLARVAGRATDRAANPMESVLRAVVGDLEGFAFAPQLRVVDTGLFATVDLGDERLKVVLEAEGFQWHGDRRALRRDCRRYDDLVAHGWTVFRFSWEDIMLRPDYVRWCLETWLAEREGRMTPQPPRLPRRLA